MEVLILILVLFTSYQLIHIKRKVYCIMATFAEVKATLASVAAGVDSLEDAIKALKAEVAAGKVITQVELDELAAAAAAIGTDIADTSDQ